MDARRDEKDGIQGTLNLASLAGVQVTKKAKVDGHE
jgi:hypothetical protein